MFDMQKQLRWAKLKVGLVITLALVTLFLAVFFAGSIENILAPKVELIAQLKDAKGLRKGAPIWISGTEVGSVKKIKLNPSSGVLLTLSINENALQFLKQDSQAIVLSLGLLGDKYVELTTGSPKAGPVNPGDIIQGTVVVELQDVIETSAQSIEKMTEFVQRLDSLVNAIEKGGGTVARFISDPAVYDNLKNATKTLAQIMEDLNNSRGTLRKLAEDPVLYNKMLSVVSSLEDFTKVLNNSSGSLKKLAEDPTLYNNLNKALLELTSLLESIQKGQGVAGTLISDKELAGELKDSIRELKELTQDIKKNPKKYFKFSLF